MQVRVWELQEEGAVTDDDWYAVTELPSLMVPPQGRVQEFGEGSAAEAEMERVRHAPQLLFVFDSVMDVLPDVFMFAQARTLYVPAEVKV